MAPKSSRKRDPLSPLPVLDRALLLKSLSSASIHLKPKQLDIFYQQLHQQKYPSLPDYVKSYHASQKAALKERQDEGESTSEPKKRRSRQIQLPHSFLKHLTTENFVTLTSSVEDAPTSLDGTTTKLTIKLQDDHLVESVIMRHTGRITICVSSQVGCAMGCTFCATGTMGIKGDMHEGEILEQLVHATAILEREGNPARIRNLVFMGMGEPLNNYDNVVSACRSIMDRRTWNLAHGRITVSTVGVADKMRELTKDCPEVNMALSLHAPNQEARVKIVPAARKYPIEDVVQALHEHVCSGRKTSKGMIEYVMLEGETTTLKCAHQLGALCKTSTQIVVNLIPYNRTDVRDKLHCPSEEHISKFQSIVTSYGVQCFVRRTMGADIAGACGQLVVKKNKNKTKDIEDVSCSCGAGGCGGAGQCKCGANKKSVSGGVVVSRRKNKAIVLDSPNVEELPSSSKETGDADKWIRALAAATAVSTICLVLSTGLLLTRKMGRKQV